jgi:hypothetical protein
MDYSKLDAGLRADFQRYEAISDRMYPVFIHTSAPVNEEHVRFLKELGVGNVKSGMKVMTATLPYPAISILSDQEWVSAIRLSRKMQPI